MKRSALATALVLVLAAAVGSGCSSLGWTPGSQDITSSTFSLEQLSAQAKASLAEAAQGVPWLTPFFEEAYGYAFFPNVGKGAVGIGGAHGNGYVFEQGKLIGRTTLSQLTIGLQLGGQSYRELIFFRDKAALERFVGGNFELGAQASAVAIGESASVDAAYEDGVAIITLEGEGLMYEASVGGQKFTFERVAPSPESSAKADPMKALEPPDVPDVDVPSVDDPIEPMPLQQDD